MGPQASHAAGSEVSRGTADTGAHRLHHGHQRQAENMPNPIVVVRRLNREVVKLEAFKKNLIQQLQDEDGEVGVVSAGSAAVAPCWWTPRLAGLSAACPHLLR